MTTAAAGDLNVSDLLLEGETMRADVTAAIDTPPTVERTIEGASTLSFSLRDPHRRLLTSGIFGNRVTAQLDRWSFELVKVAKSGTGISLVFEDLAVAALRRRDAPRKVEGGTMTRVDFARELVAEEPWIIFRGPMAASEVAKIEMARGQVATDTEEEEREDTWEALGRLATEVGWRRFARDGEVWFTPDAFLFLAEPAYILRPGGDGVDEVDFDFDIGKPVATLTATVRANRWDVPPGEVVAVEGCGPADGKWLVANITRALTEANAAVTLIIPQPMLPEPDPPPPPAANEDVGANEGAGVAVDGGAGEGATVDTGPASAGGYVWPLRGTVTSGFGQRNGRLHAGIDISVGVGTPVGATRDGTVTFAGSASGYGNVVYISHGNAESRYAHLSSIECRRGQAVKAGQRIGKSGGARGAPGAGNSTGPHLHFEIRPGGSPADPMRFLGSGSGRTGRRPGPPI